MLDIILVHIPWPFPLPPSLKEVNKMCRSECFYSLSDLLSITASHLTVMGSRDEWAWGDPCCALSPGRWVSKEGRVSETTASLAHVNPSGAVRRGLKVEAPQGRETNFLLLSSLYYEFIFRHHTGHSFYVPSDSSSTSHWMLLMGNKPEGQILVLL